MSLPIAATNREAVDEALKVLKHYHESISQVRVELSVHIKALEEHPPKVYIEELKSFLGDSLVESLRAQQ